MSFTLSRNLRLRIDSGLTANSKYNLNRIDLLGSVISVDTTEATAIRSRADITIEPQSAAVGGSGVGGSIQLGTSGHSLTSVDIHSAQVLLSSPLSLKDTNSLFYTAIRNSSTGATANNFLTFNSNNSDRSISLLGDLSFAGSFSTSGLFSTVLTATANTTLTLPVTGTLATLDGTETLTNKTVTGTFTGNITGNVSGTAANITGVAAIANGGTGQSSLPAALNALLPVQTGNSGKLLVSDGTNASWVAAGGGSVTSVDASVPAGFTVSGNPVTTSGTIAIGLSTQSVGKLLVGPATGGDAAPTFRRLSVEDIPTGIDHSQLNALSLLNDDHTQYHTDGRALTWLGTRSTSDLPEGTNKYLTAANLTAGADTDDLNEGTTNLYYTNTRADARITLQKAAVNGLATLDGGGKIPVAQLPAGLMTYKGNWNASTNSPTLIDGTGTTGDVYRVSVAGTQDLGSGSQVFSIGDWVAYNGTIWERADNSDAVTSVNALSGAVVLTTTNIAEGTNLYYTTSRFNTSIAARTVFNTWIPANGTTKVVTHSFGSTAVNWNIYDLDTGEEIWPDTAIRTDSNNMTFVSSTAPVGTGWEICIRKNN